MKLHALVVDDSPDVLDDAKDRLEALGHTCDCVTSLQDARDHLAKNQYSHALVDLEIPVRYGKPPRIENGKLLVRQIRAMSGYETLPIIVITSHGHDSPDLAVDVLRNQGATDFVRKPFPDKDRTLEKAVTEALDASGRLRPGAAKLSSLKKNQPPQPFERGEMVFFADRVELCGVKVCGDGDSGLIRRVLDQLKAKKPSGLYVAYDGNKLAKLAGCDTGQNGVAGAVREFRKKAAQLLLEEANIQLRPRNVIQSGGRGYRLSEKIVVRDGNDPVYLAENRDDAVNDGVNGRREGVNDGVNGPIDGRRDPVNGPLLPAGNRGGAATAAHGGAVPAGSNGELTERQQWAMDRLRTGGTLRVSDLIKQFKCSKTTAGRVLIDLRNRKLVEFCGPPKTGHWRLVR